MKFELMGCIGAVPSGRVAEKAPPMKGSRSFIFGDWEILKNWKLAAAELKFGPETGLNYCVVLCFFVSDS